MGRVGSGGRDPLAGFIIISISRRELQYIKREQSRFFNCLHVELK